MIRFRARLPVTFQPSKHCFSLNAFRQCFQASKFSTCLSKIDVPSQEEELEQLKSLQQTSVPYVDFERYVEEGQKPKRLGSAGRRAARESNAQNEWKCGQCGLFKSESNYHKQTSSKSGFRSLCKDCVAQYQASRRETLRGALQSLLGNARGRRHTSDLCLDHPFTIYKMQRGRCAYSGCWLVVKANSAFTMSLERAQNNTGYTRGNCSLVSVEFNTTDHTAIATGLVDVTGSAKWSREKFEAVPSLRSKPVDLEALTSMVEGARQRPSSRSHFIKNYTQAPKDHKWCNRCSIGKPFYCFHVNSFRIDGLSSYCKDCKQEVHSLYRGILDQYWTDWINYPEKKHLSLDDVLDMIIKQNGRCFYSGVPLEFLRTHCNWRWSIERLNVEIGYDLQNTVLSILSVSTKLPNGLEQKLSSSGVHSIIRDEVRSLEKAHNVFKHVEQLMLTQTWRWFPSVVPY